MGWSYRDWSGPFYAPGVKAADYLRQYAREFTSVEVDSTFYGTPAVDRLQRWARSVPAHFTFALKLPREITHERRLVGCANIVTAFFAAAQALGSQLEAVLVQLPPDFRPDEWDALATFVPLLPAGARIALEVRDPRWFGTIWQAELLALLREYGVALAVCDGTFVDLNLMLAALARPTAPFAYIRWLGRRDSVVKFDRVTIDRSAQIARWSAALQSAAPHLERVCGYANNHYMGHGPATVRAMNQALGLENKPVGCEQTELFPPHLS